MRMKRYANLQNGAFFVDEGVIYQKRTYYGEDAIIGSEPLAVYGHNVCEHKPNHVVVCIWRKEIINALNRITAAACRKRSICVSYRHAHKRRACIRPRTATLRGGCK